MDGLTTVLLCQAPVLANQTNTMKLAIGDVGDRLYDSNVFIEAGSLTTVPPLGTPTDVVGNPEQRIGDRHVDTPGSGSEQTDRHVRGHMHRHRQPRRLGHGRASPEPNPRPRSTA